MSTGNPRVAAVLTVFNQAEGACRCVEALLAQSTPVARIYVLFNGTAKDGQIADAFTEKFRQHSNVEVLRSPENIGNAGGVKLAMRAALNRGVEWIWIVEDDALPHRDALERLIASGMQTDCVYGSLIVDPKSKDLAFPYATIEPDRRQRIISTISELPNSNIFSVRGLWLGALIPIQVVNTVGEVNADLFIRGEDEEYPARIRKAGFKFACVRDSIIEHPRIRHVHLAAAGANFFYEKNLPIWKAYFLVRNQVFVRRMYPSRGFVSGWFRAIATIFLSILCTVVFDNQKLKRVLTCTRAGWHGLTGQLRIKPRGIERAT